MRTQRRLSAESLNTGLTELWFRWAELFSLETLTVSAHNNCIHIYRKTFLKSWHITHNTQIEKDCSLVSVKSLMRDPSHPSMQGSLCKVSCLFAQRLQWWTGLHMYILDVEHCTKIKPDAYFWTLNMTYVHFSWYFEMKVFVVIWKHN